MSTDCVSSLKAGIAAYQDGYYEQAAACFEQALHLAEADGPKSQFLYPANLWLGEVNLVLARWAQAEKFSAAAFDCQEKNLGDFNSDDLDLESLGARLLSRQDKPAEAEVLASQLLARAKEISGADSLLVAARLNTLALVLDQAGKSDEGTALLRRALVLRERIAGADSLAYAESLTNLALNYARENNTTSAEMLCRRALSLREKRLRETHPLIGYSFYHLATQKLRQGDHNRAYDCFCSALKIFEKELPEHHPQIGNCLSGLASAAIAQRNFEQAQLLFERALRIAESEEGKSDISILSAASGLGLAYLSQNQFAKAEPHIKRALKLVEDSRQLQAAAEKGLLDRLMVCYVLQGKIIDAMRLYPDSMRARHTSEFESFIDGLKMVAKLAQRHLGPKDEA